MEAEVFIAKAQRFKVTNSILLKLQRQYVMHQRTDKKNGQSSRVVEKTPHD